MSSNGLILMSMLANVERISFVTWEDEFTHAPIRQKTDTSHLGGSIKLHDGIIPSTRPLLW